VLVAAGRWGGRFRADPEETPVSVQLEFAPRKITSRTTLRANNPLHVLIVGASYGGLALAHGLRRAGVSCALYESRRSRADRRADGRAGPGVAIDAMGNRALRECLPPDLFAAFLATRQPLRQLLLAGLADRVHCGKAFTHYERHDEGTVTAFFADGGSATGQVLVAADGARSVVRTQYLRELVPRRHLSVLGCWSVRDPAGAFPLQVTSSELAPAWQASNVTVVGDAIHAVTPGPRAGANTSLRDAMLLSRALSFVQANRLGLCNAVAAYEAEMVRFDRARVDDKCCPR
jgi:2-polyprenyl-6-methoxyphenol hydroxylase-like FAD-dependent oxidoreductase